MRVAKTILLEKNERWATRSHVPDLWALVKARLAEERAAPGDREGPVPEGPDCVAAKGGASDRAGCPEVEAD
eukprot:9090717-Pyramimonas_sp.AAC.1